ncbi:MAG: SIS domain-containing protein, partial [Acidobacteriota bacterium]
MLKNARQVLEIEARAIRDLANRLDDRFLKAVEILGNCRGRVVVTGMGKSGLIGSKIAATLASTGTPALFLHPAEALHGDIGMVTEQDVVLAISNSGETAEILRLVNFLQRLSIPMISLLGRRESTLARYSAVVLDVSIQQEACPLGLAPTASTTAALALGDALAMTLSQKKGFTSEDFAVR